MSFLLLHCLCEEVAANHLSWLGPSLSFHPGDRAHSTPPAGLEVSGLSSTAAHSPLNPGPRSNPPPWVPQKLIHGTPSLCPSSGPWLYLSLAKVVGAGERQRQTEIGREGERCSVALGFWPHQGPLAMNKAPLGGGGSHLAYGPQEMPVAPNQPSLGRLSPWVSS